MCERRWRKEGGCNSSSARKCKAKTVPKKKKKTSMMTNKSNELFGEEEL